MENQPGTIGSLLGSTEEYINTRLELLKLQAVDKSSDVASSLVSRIVILIFAIFAIFLINIGLAIWIGELLEKVYMGFFIVGAFYCLLGLLFYIFRKNWVKDPVTVMLIKKLIH